MGRSHREAAQHKSHLIYAAVDNGLVWLTGEVVCSPAAYHGSDCSSAHAINGRI